MPKDRNTTFDDVSKAAGRNTRDDYLTNQPSTGNPTTTTQPPIQTCMKPQHNVDKSVPNDTKMERNLPRNDSRDAQVPLDNRTQIVHAKPAENSVESVRNQTKQPTTEQKSTPRAQTIVYVQGGTAQGRPPTVSAHPQDVAAYYHPSVVPYVSAHPHESVASHSHYAHHHPGHWAPTPAPSYAWVPAAPQPGQPAATHHHNQIHTPYEYHVGAGVSHVTVSPSPYPQMPGAVWANHPSYPTPVPVPSAHYAHYYPPSHPTHVQGTYAHSAVPNEQAALQVSISKQEGSVVKRQQETVNGVKSSGPENQDKSQSPTKVESKDLREKPGGPSKIATESNPGTPSKGTTANGENPGAKKPTSAAATGSGKESTSTRRNQEKQSVQQPIRKTRKPYTITKNRESWSEKEHQLFVTALQLYNRDWKRIEAYIGTKTVLQIRSHAQKHFSKVTKYKTGEYIPPPRPKRRASRPYPRSRGVDPPKKTEKSPEAATQKSSDGAKTTSDSFAGSSENGNVSGNGKSSSGGSSDCVANSAPTSGQRNNERSSGAVVNSTEKRHGARTPYTQSAPSSSGYLTMHKSSNIPPSHAPPRLQECYNPYYYNTARANPNSLPYPPGYYQNHYSQPPLPVPQPQPFFACYDQNCSHYHAYQGHGHLHLTHPSHQRNVPGTHQPPQYPPQPVATHHQRSVPQRPGEPAPVKWADNAAARRAHRARIIRGRKTTNAKHSSQESDEVKEADIVADRDNKTRNEQRVESQNEDKTVRNSGNEKSATVASLLNSSSQEPRSNILVNTNTGSAITGLMDVGSDEAVAGFSGSDGQGSGSDGSPQEGQLRGGTPEEDPNSSSGDDGRGRNTRGSSPTDPNSGGSREDTPCQNEMNGSRNASSQGGVTPSVSRETTPSENGGSTTQGVKKNGAMDAAKALLKYRNSSNQAKNGTKSKTCRKAGIDNLLNSSPQMVDIARRSPTSDQKRGRSPPNDIHHDSGGGKGGTVRYKDEPDSQRRRHNSVEVEPVPESR